MNKTVLKEPITILSFVLFLIFTIWWVSHFLRIIPDEFLPIDVFSDLYGILALIGGVWGLYVSKFWGGTKSVMGRVVIAFSVGLLCQFFGQVVYSYYYYVEHIENPYPSIGDIGFYATIPAYIYGVVELSRALGVGLGLTSFLRKPLSVLLPLAMLFFSYEVFLLDYVVEGSTPLIVFLDFVNPLGQAMYISLALLVFLNSIKLLGGVMKKPIIILLLGLVFQYAADFIFLYKTNQDTWVSGDISEYLYLTAYFIITMAIVELYLTFNKLNEGGVNA